MSACGGARPEGDAIVVALANSPVNLDPRVGADEASQKAHQLLYSTLVRIDANLKVAPELAELDTARPGYLHRAASPRCALPQRPGAHVRGRRLHVPQFSRSRVPGTIGRVSPARLGRGEGSVHRRVQTEGAVRLVSDQPRHGDRAGRIRRGQRAAADGHRSLHDEVVRARTIASCSSRSISTTVSARRMPWC